MASPREKLAASLENLKQLQIQGMIAIPSKALSRLHRERLVRHGFLEEVMKGWYISSRPDNTAGESTAWYTAYWDFCAAYLQERFQDAWCLSPEQSLLLHAGNWTIPQQLLIYATQGGNKITSLPYKTSLFDVRYKLPPEENIEIHRGLRLFSISQGLIRCASSFFTSHPAEARALLDAISEPSNILRILLSEGHSTVAGRLIGALHNVGKDDMALEIEKTMQTAGYVIRVDDPFANKTLLLQHEEQIPQVTRMQILWYMMREKIISCFPKPPHIILDNVDYLKQIDEIYVTDAYNSLSIEGYRVSEQLIERVRQGKWHPDNSDADQQDRNAIAARGYWQAFQAVKRSVEQVLLHRNAGDVVKKDHADWYRELFGPSIVAGILKPTDLAGYRHHPVYIRRSMHVPPSHTTVRYLMSAFFKLLAEETEASVRIVLGHFFFVNIHPYMDGNGRIGRFLMNVMFASGGYPWLVIPVTTRDVYMASLEAASVKQDIEPFCDFIADLIARQR